MRHNVFTAWSGKSATAGSSKSCSLKPLLIIKLFFFEFISSPLKNGCYLNYLMAHCLSQCDFTAPVVL